MEIIELKNTIIKIKTQWMDLLVEATEDKSIKFNKYEQERHFQKNIYFCFIDCTKTFDCVDYNKLWKILRDRNTRPPYLPPEKSVYRSRSNS